MTDQLAPGPIPHWPGAPVALGVGEVFVRSAPAQVPAAEPAVLVHGLGGSSRNWTDLMAELSQPASGPAEPVLASQAIDLPGFGYSPPPADGDYSIDAHAAAVIALIDASGRWPVHLIGNSLGGAVRSPTCGPGAARCGSAWWACRGSARGCSARSWPSRPSGAPPPPSRTSTRTRAGSTLTGSATRWRRSTAATPWTISPRRSPSRPVPS